MTTQNNELNLVALESLDLIIHQMIADFFQPKIPNEFELKVDISKGSVILYKKGGRGVFTISGSSDVEISFSGMGGFDQVLYDEITTLLGACLKYREYLLKYDCTYQSTKEVIGE